METLTQELLNLLNEQVMILSDNGKHKDACELSEKILETIKKYLR